MFHVKNLGDRKIIKFPCIEIWSLIQCCQLLYQFFIHFQVKDPILYLHQACHQFGPKPLPQILLKVIVRMPTYYANMTIHWWKFANLVPKGAKNFLRVAQKRHLTVFNNLLALLVLVGKLTKKIPRTTSIVSRLKNDLTKKSVQLCLLWTLVYKSCILIEIFFLSS